MTAPPHLPNSFLPTRKAIGIIAVPKTAAMNRQPKEWKPKTLIPTATIHLPSGGWTKDCSVGWVVPQNGAPLPRYRQASLA